VYCPKCPIYSIHPWKYEKDKKREGKERRWVGKERGRKKARRTVEEDKNFEINFYCKATGVFSELISRRYPNYKYSNWPKKNLLVAQLLICLLYLVTSTGTPLIHYHSLG
jgi:hypothetical protein